MDQREYYFYTFRDPDEYWTEYGRSVSDISIEELKEATLKYDAGLPNYIKHLEEQEQLALNQRRIRELISTITNDNGRVAQLDVQQSSKLKVEGSNPSTPTKPNSRIEDILIED